MSKGGFVAQEAADYASRQRDRAANRLLADVQREAERLANEVHRESERLAAEAHVAGAYHEYNYRADSPSVPITGLTDRLERMEDQLVQVFVVLEDIVNKIDWMVEAFQEDE